MTDLPLVQLLFRSMARPGLDAAGLRDIAKVVVRHNAAADLSGLLIFHEGCFVQWLEGTGMAVQAAWSRIRRDQRHGAIENTSLSAGSVRLFPDWRIHLDTGDGDPVASGIDVPVDVLAALLRPQADLVELFHGLSFWRSLPSPQTMARLLALGPHHEVRAWTDSVAALRPSWTALGRHLLGPAERALGDAWMADQLQSGDLSIAQARLQMLLRQAGPHGTGTQSNARLAGRALLAVVPGEPDLTGLSLAGMVLDSAGWHVQCLFPRSAGELVAHLRAHPVDLLHLSLSDSFDREHRLVPLCDLIQLARQASCNPLLVVLVGGRLFAQTPGLAAVVGADAPGLAQGSTLQDLQHALAWGQLRSWSPAIARCHASLSNACALARQQLGARAGEAGTRQP